MSALQIPSRTRRTAPSPRRATDPAGTVLRLVESPSPTLAPSGPVQAWRRRIGALVVLVAALLLVVEAVTGPVVPTQEVVPATATTVVVEPGQTLWDVASQHAPADVGAAAYVRELAELNGISNGAVDAWQVLRLPVA